VTPARRDFFDLLQKPDLYGPLWVPSSVAFLAFALGNLTTWLHTSHDFAYNFGSLVSAFFWLMAFVFGSPFLFKYWGTDHTVVNLMTLSGYSTVYVIPPALGCVVLGKAFGFMAVLTCAAIGAFSVSQKTDGTDIRALPGAPGRGQGRVHIFNRMGFVHMSRHLVLYFVCFF
jgi:hypothetical protein